MKPHITKVTTHISQNESLIFERSQPGRAGFSLPPLDVDESPLDEIIPAQYQREDDLVGMPEVTEVDVVRHPLVQKIIVAYEERDRNKRSAAPPET